MVLVAFSVILSLPVGSFAHSERAKTTAVSVDPNGNNPMGAADFTMSADGNRVAFITLGRLLPADTDNWNDVYMRDLSSGDLFLVSDSDEVDTEYGGSAGGDFLALSHDGRYVAYWSRTGLVRRDMLDGSVVTIWGGAPTAISISGDGKVISFIRIDNVGSGIFVWEESKGASYEIAHADYFSGQNTRSQVSDDGRWIAFSLRTPGLAPEDPFDDSDVFAYELATGRIELVSAGSSGQPHGWSGWPAISADGRFVAFGSTAADLVADDTNGSWDYFVRDRLTDTTERISVHNWRIDLRKGGEVSDEPWQTEAIFWSPSISADGRFVSFGAESEKLVAGDCNHHSDVFVFDRLHHTIARVSIREDGSEFMNTRRSSVISDDGRYVAFLGWDTATVYRRDRGRSPYKDVQWFLAGTASEPLQEVGGSLRQETVYDLGCFLGRRGL